MNYDSQCFQGWQIGSGAFLCHSVPLCASLCLSVWPSGPLWVAALGPAAWAFPFALSLGPCWFYAANVHKNDKKTLNHKIKGVGGIREWDKQMTLRATGWCEATDIHPRRTPSKKHLQP